MKDLMISGQKGKRDNEKSAECIKKKVHKSDMELIKPRLKELKTLFNNKKKK